MKKVLFIAVAALAFVACKNNTPAQEVEAEVVDSTVVEVAPVDVVDSAAVAVEEVAAAAVEEVKEAVK
ncbi:MAG: hypothetical protein J6Z32_04610 [Bacteroidales bacterium]|nr:hypothetical protein [Bacteroidales bacterium]